MSWFNDPAAWGAGAKQIAPGDTVHLCGIFSGMVEPKGDGAISHPVTILFESNAAISAATFWNSERKFGTAINLDSRHDLIIDGGRNGRIEATSNGTPGAWKHSDNITGVDVNAAANITIRNLTIAGMYRRTPGSHDANKFGCGSWGREMRGTNVFENNKVIDANCGVQWNTASDGGSMIVRGNTIRRVSWGFASDGGGDVRLTFSQNTLADGFVWSGEIATGDGHFHNDPFHLWTTSTATHFRELRIDSNRIEGDWGDNTTGGIFLECRGEDDCPALIYNNIFNSYTAFTNGAVALKHTRGARIFNNLFHGPGTAVAIENNTYGDPSAPSSAIDVVNNVFFQVDTALAATDNSSFGRVDFNAYWKAPKGEDAHGVESDPLLNESFIPAPGSSLIDRGSSLHEFFSVDRRGTPRPQGKAWDVGPFEVVSSPK